MSLICRIYLISNNRNWLFPPAAPNSSAGHGVVAGSQGRKPQYKSKDKSVRTSHNGQQTMPDKSLRTFFGGREASVLSEAYHPY